MSAFQSRNTQEYVSSQLGSKHHTSKSRVHRQTAAQLVCLSGASPHLIEASNTRGTMRSVSRINGPVPPSISANMAPSRLPSTLSELKPAQAGTGTSLIGGTLSRLRHAPTTCKHTAKKARMVTRSSFFFPRAPMGSPGGCERARTRRRRLLFPGKFCLPELDPAGAVQSSGRRPVSLEAGRDQQHHRASWTNRVLTPARLAATRLQGGRAVGAQ